MKNRVLRNSRQLAEAGLINDSQMDDIDKVASRYSVAVSSGVAAMINSENPNDPIAKQFVPSVEELDNSDSELDDPIGDRRHSPVRGVVHRYPDRALFMPTHVCPAYCRYCFRREFVGKNGAGALSSTELTDCYRYFREHPELWEIILSGGDPLVLSTQRIATILRELDAIQHIRVLRIHTRVPTVAPEKISLDLVKLLKSTDKAVFLVLHINHRDELAATTRDACAQLIDAGIPVLSQTVLLRGVNDSPEVLGDLMRALVENRIKPYYLHHCDLAPGTDQFRTTIATGQHIMREVRGELSGLCQPSYMLDIPGGAGKTPIGPNYIVPVDSEQTDGSKYRVEDYKGEHHKYVCSNSDAPGQS